MKVAISVPDHVFEAGERASRRMRVSRSRLYATALEAYLGRDAHRDVTDRLDAVYSKQTSALEPLMEAASLEVLRREKWRGSVSSSTSDGGRLATSAPDRPRAAR